MVQITAKRKDILGPEFSGEGIIRNMLQSNLFQVACILAMDRPASLSPEDLRDEKVKIAKRIKAIKLEDLVLGQYGNGSDGTPGFAESFDHGGTCNTATFATCALYIQHPQWKDVPIVLKAGYGLNEHKTEIRVQFRLPATSHEVKDISPNELVMRFEPDLAVYLKMYTKKPGLSNEASLVELDMTYKKRLQDDEVHVLEPSAGVIYNALHGNHSHSIRADGLYASWKIWEPLITQVEAAKIKPVIYPYGTRGPAESDALIKRLGFKRSDNYVWHGASK